MKPRIYSVILPEFTVRYQCDRTVVRFRSLSVGKVFLIGADEEKVYMKSSPLTVTSLIPLANTVDIPVNDNPWCEPLVEVTT